MMHEYNYLAAAEVNEINIIKKIKKFYQQINFFEDILVSLISEIINKKNFEIIISSDKENESNDNDNTDFIINDEIN